MPLKHTTETRLVIVLGGILVGVGFSVRLLPPLPNGAFLFGGLWLLSLLYPLLLLPLFRARRAEYAFRILHFLPSLLLLMWAAFPVLRSSGVPTGSIEEWYTWEQGLLPIVFSMLLLLLYCLRVVRQRISRSIVLSTFLLFFVVASVHGQFWSWSDKLGSWRDLLAFSSKAPLEDTSSAVNTDPSSSLGEEVWRMRLRRMHRRQGRLLQDDGLVDRPALPMRGAPVLLQASSSSHSVGSGSSTTPPKLVSSGMGLEWSVVLLLALYTGILHVRARRRV